jgi:hypothetical protein
VHACERAYTYLFVIFQFLEQLILLGLSGRRRILLGLDLFGRECFLLRILFGTLKDEADRSGPNFDGSQDPRETDASTRPHFVAERSRAHGDNVSLLDLCVCVMVYGMRLQGQPK